MHVKALVYLLSLSVATSGLTLRPHELQHTRLPCPSLSLWVCSNSWPLSWWCHPTISSSVALFFSCPQSFLASGSSPVNRLFISGGQSIGASASASYLSFQWISRVDFLWDQLAWSPYCPRDSQESSSAPQFEGIISPVPQVFSTQPSLWPISPIYTRLLEKL